MSSVFGIGLPELLLIFIVVLIFVGPKKLPVAGAALGKALREFRASFNSDKTRSEEPAAGGQSGGTAAAERTGVGQD